MVLSFFTVKKLFSYPETNNSRSKIWKILHAWWNIANEKDNFVTIYYHVNSDWLIYDNVLVILVSF